MVTKTIPHIYFDACCFIDAVKYDVGTLPAARDNDAWFIDIIGFSVY
jgi:hypothetical protein